MRLKTILVLVDGLARRCNTRECTIPLAIDWYGFYLFFAFFFLSFLSGNFCFCFTLWIVGGWKMEGILHITFQIFMKHCETHEMPVLVCSEIATLSGSANSKHSHSIPKIEAFAFFNLCSIIFITMWKYINIKYL